MEAVLATYNEQLLRIWEQYRQEVSPDPVDLKVVAAWAISKGLWKLRPVELSAKLAEELANSLREQTRTDNKGRNYRAFIPVRKRGASGVPLFEWADIDVAPRAHVEKSIQQERRSIASDCFALVMKVDHYNDTHPNEEPLQTVFDFTDDVAEEKVARGINDDKAA